MHLKGLRKYLAGQVAQKVRTERVSDLWQGFSKAKRGASIRCAFLAHKLYYLLVYRKRSLQNRLMLFFKWPNK